MRLCPVCGEIYADRTQRCRAHDAALLDWSQAADTNPGAFTDVDRPATRQVRLDPSLDPTPLVEVVGETQRTRAPSGGRVLGGRYRLGKQLGVGGFGAVFAADDLVAAQQVAVKVLSPAATQSPTLITRFHREAIAASRVRHPHIVEVADFDVDADGSHFIVMEHLDGRDLADLLGQEGALAPARALAIAAQCARGLAAAHRAGILHRDLKPANVFLVRNAERPDSVKVIDFGISKLTRAAGDFTDVTHGSKVVGTPCYMSPEQARGAALDGRCDVYALGVMLFEMLVGERPFTGRAPIEILSKHLDAPRIPPSRLQPALAACPGLDHLVLTAIAADPARRHRSMAAFGEAIVACLRAIHPEGAEHVTEITGELTEANEVPRRRAHRALGGVLAAAAAVMMLGLAVWPTSASDPVEPAPVARAAIPTIAPTPPQGAALVPPAPPPPVDPLAGTHEVLLTSSPSGAVVDRDGVSLGVTPMRFVVDAATESVELSIAARGRRSGRVVVNRDRDAFHVTLPRKPAKPARPAATKLGVEEW